MTLTLRNQNGEVRDAADRPLLIAAPITGLLA